MEYSSAELLGTLLGHIVDFFVFVPALAAGALSRSRLQLLIGGVLVWVIVLAIKVPMIRDVAEELNIPDRSLLSIAIWYAASVALLASAAFAVRRLTSGQGWRI